MPNPKAVQELHVTLQQLENLQCQLLSLEVSLQNSARLRALPRKDYEPRAAYLERIRHRLAHLKVLLEASAVRPAEDDIGFPALEHCSVEELRVCESYIGRRLGFCEDLYQTLMKLYQWVSRAYQGKGDGIIATMRLAKLKKWLQQTENEHARLSIDEREMEHTTEKLAMTIRADHENHHLSGNLEALIGMFKEIDTLNHRIAGLKLSLSRYDEQAGTLKEWLKVNEPQALKQREMIDIPTIQNIQEAKDYFSQEVYGAGESENRLTLARRFVESCLSPGEDNKDDLLSDPQTMPPTVAKENRHAN